MKKILSILPISIAILFITVLSIVPHHHHEQVMCMTVEVCDGDVACDIQHSLHDTARGDSGDGDACAAIDTQYIVASNTFKGSSISEDVDSHSILECFCLLASYLIHTSESATIQTIHNKNIVFYESALLGLSSGLRAPPYCLS